MSANRNYKSTVLESSHTLKQATKSSVFDRLVKEVNVEQIPPKYVDKVIIEYHDGTSVEIAGSDISTPVILDRKVFQSLETNNQRIKDMKALINLEKLERDINKKVEESLGKYC